MGVCYAAVRQEDGESQHVLRWVWVCISVGVGICWCGVGVCYAAVRQEDGVPARVEVGVGVGMGVVWYGCAMPLCIRMESQHLFRGVVWVCAMPPCVRTESPSTC